MDSPSSSSSPPPRPMISSASDSAAAGAPKEVEKADVAAERKESWAGLVDPFLVEVLENPRHRLTVLRMELDIQRFMQNSEQQQFEFQHLPTSYLRCVAHRVAQHYGLQTMSADSILDGPCSRIIALKTPESRFPSFLLSDVPIKQTENQKTENIKIAIRRRPNRTFHSDATGLETKANLVKTMEEREEEYEKARARIFSDSCALEKEPYTAAGEVRESPLSRVEQENIKTSLNENENMSIKDGVSQVAIIKDREKDRSDPDYDRSYDRYARGPTLIHNFGIGSRYAFQLPMIEYETGFSQFGQFPRNQPSVSYQTPDFSMNPYTPRCYQTPAETLYMQWPTPATMYAHSYEHLRHGIFQAPPYQQPLSFEHMQKH